MYDERWVTFALIVVLVSDYRSEVLRDAPRVDVGTSALTRRLLSLAIQKPYTVRDAPRVNVGTSALTRRLL